MQIGMNWGTAGRRSLSCELGGLSCRRKSKRAREELGQGQGLEQGKCRGKAREELGIELGKLGKSKARAGYRDFLDIVPLYQEG
ncbi:hypothetical protein J2Z66_002467 [Paenibacillus eucommiae]|uniref:Uncharacterized protein n=1 Tax=Paenibacillus eucommiae TaxID=1355755 RepID=A0ABS4ITF3_9BACL|nr:hypothetical protein [Paenibacillus eucommiae]